MSDSVVSLLRDALPLLGVVVGGILAAWLGTRGEARRWRREWVTDLSRQQIDFLAESMHAIDRQYVVMGKCMEASLGRRAPLPRSEIAEADAAWGRVLSFSKLRAQPDVQLAMGAYDKARSACVNAINGKDPAAMDATYADVDTTRVEYIAECNMALANMGLHVARHVLPLRVRTWRRLTGKGLDYL